jgi:hypothetical protein
MIRRKSLRSAPICQGEREEAAKTWARERLSNRIDAIIIHELAEADAGTHEAALRLAPETERPISEGTRKILRAMRDGWKGR